MENYEQKYKEALERASKLRVQNPFDTVGQMVENIFPELKESEDERIRKEIIDFVKSRGGFKGDWIAWLEKQAEPNPYSGTSFEYNGHIWGMCARDNGVEILFDGELKAFISLEKSFIYPIYPKPDLAHKSAIEAIKDNVGNNNKVEPKFHEGDWVILTAGELSTTLQIVNVDTNKKLYWFNDNSYLPIVDEECLHLWTIQDAKDGNVLCFHNTATAFFLIGIFKRVASQHEIWGQTYITHIQYGGYGSIENYTLRVALGDDELHHCGSIACPATKEQRDLLFSKMKEAGYEWNDEKKELKKIEDKTLDADKVIE